jgi:hypothetical protein
VGASMVALTFCKLPQKSITTYETSRSQLKITSFLKYGSAQILKREVSSYYGSANLQNKTWFIDYHGSANV